MHISLHAEEEVSLFRFTYSIIVCVPTKQGTVTILTHKSRFLAKFLTTSSFTVEELGQSISLQLQLSNQYSSALELYLQRMWG